MRIMVNQIRQLEVMIGNKGFKCSSEELEKRSFFRRGLYASRDIVKGNKILYDDPVRALCLAFRDKVFKFFRRIKKNA